jgi:hypothetical protein
MRNAGLHIAPKPFKTGKPSTSLLLTPVYLISFLKLNIGVKCPSTENQYPEPLDPLVAPKQMNFNSLT